MTRPRRRVGVLAAAAGAIVLLGGGVAIATTTHGDRAPSTAQGASRAAAAVDVRSLPVARYDAVIPGLVPYAASRVPATADRAYSVRSDVAVYGAVDGKPVARLAARDFLDEPTVVVVVARAKGWAQVLLPSRQALPSSAGGSAPAQSAGWVHADALQAGAALDARVVVSVSTGVLSVVDRSGSTRSRFTIGVGAPGTPTPTGVMGYIQARYKDAEQGQAVYPITLTSLHATAADEPYEGDDGGLIGMHWNAVTSGAVSHGCLRLPPAALAAIGALPLGTPVLLTA